MEGREGKRIGQCNKGEQSMLGGVAMWQQPISPNWGFWGSGRAVGKHPREKGIGISRFLGSI